MLQSSGIVPLKALSPVKFIVQDTDVIIPKAPINLQYYTSNTT